MSTEPIRRYYKCYHPWRNRITGEFKALSYWILWPNIETFDVNKEYPLFVMFQGGLIYSKTRLYHEWSSPRSGKTTIQVHNWDINYTHPDSIPDYTSPYYTHESIVILPDTSDYDEWIEMNDDDVNSDFNAFINCYGATWAGMKPLRSLIESLLNKTTIFYDTPSCTTERTDLLESPTVDSSRIYAAGYCYGGGGAIAFAQELRDLVAGVVAGAGWFFDGSYMHSCKTDEFNGDNNLIEIAKQVTYRRIKKMYGIPVLFHAGELDTMWNKTSFRIEEYLRGIQKETGIPHNSYFACVPGVTHLSDGWKGWSDPSYKFDTTIHAPQAMTKNSGANLSNAIDWLYSQRRQVLPDEPYTAEVIEPGIRRYLTYGFGTVDTEKPLEVGPFTYYVDKNHINANDLNVGIYSDAPLKTIRRAIEVGREEDNVVVKIGNNYKEYNLHNLSNNNIEHQLSFSGAIIDD